MTTAKGQRHRSIDVPEELGVAFATWARTTDGGTAAALRRLVAQAIKGVEGGKGLHGARPISVTVVPRGAGRGEQVGVRLKASERDVLAAAAQAQGTVPPTGSARWHLSLGPAGLSGMPLN